MIRANGPMSIAEYMQLCLHDRQHGYYATRPGLGRDFITAPEISQIFGELLGLWAAQEWINMGRPDPFHLCEIGPGRGTLMTDALRATRNTPGFHAAMNLHFVEPSPVLRAQLTKTFVDHQPTFIETFGELSSAPSLLLANEWLDCLPVRQFTYADGDWFERVIGLAANDQLAFGLSRDRSPNEFALPGGTVEVQSGLDVALDDLQSINNQWRALLIDYGTTGSSPGDTLRSFKDGKQIDPLEQPGASDLTVDVDFQRLARLATKAGMVCDGPIPQSLLLRSLGIEARLNQLIAQNPDQKQALFSGAKRLVDPEEMGTKFQCICLSQNPETPPTGF